MADQSPSSPLSATISSAIGKTGRARKATRASHLKTPPLSPSRPCDGRFCFLKLEHRSRSATTGFAPTKTPGVLWLQQSAQAAPDSRD